MFLLKSQMRMRYQIFLWLKETKKNILKQIILFFFNLFNKITQFIKYAKQLYM